MPMSKFHRDLQEMAVIESHFRTNLLCIAPGTRTKFEDTSRRTSQTEVPLGSTLFCAKTPLLHLVMFTGILLSLLNLSECRVNVLDGGCPVPAPVVSRFSQLVSGIL